MRISLTTLFSMGWKGWQRHQNRFSGLLLPPLADSYPPPSLRALHFVTDMLKRTAAAQGKDPERDIRVFRTIIQFGRVAGIMDGAHSPDRWYTISASWYLQMARFFQEHRDKFEAVRRTQDTWRPIWKDN
jgi:hypothetical protein